MGHSTREGFLDFGEATGIIREIARLGEIQTTNHCRKRMRERNLSIYNLKTLLREGLVTGCEWDETLESFKYRIEGDVDDEQAAAITIIISHRSLLVVTVF